MANATAVQKRILKALQNFAADSHTLLQQQRSSGAHPTQEWTNEFDNRARLQGALAEAATAGGVPIEWVSQASERGAKGIGWNTNLFLRPAAPIDRDGLLARLGADWDRLARFCGIYAAPSRFTPTEDLRPRDAVEDVISTVWRRSAQIGVLLGVDGTEADQHWPHQGWMETATSAAAAVTRDQLARQWSEIAATDITGYASQSIMLGRAGIRPDPRFAPPEPDAALSELERVNTLQTAPPVPFSDAAGMRIDAAVDATGAPHAHTGDDPLMNPPTFSHRPTPPAPGVEP
ncbi:hypothetical protein ACFU44_06050 [Nocardia rhizosphaerihabitans]|uniref:hypothetical protein n=1 Tax=Nocardia rhizosphaerihabitans TaxID=1691570 RepID=UPI00366E2B6F